MSHYDWFDFEEDQSSDEIPDKYILTIERVDAQGHGQEEVAVIVHRTADGKYPLDGEIVHRKRRMAQRIVDLLNEHGMGVE
jgi:hypothetical protein